MRALVISIFLYACESWTLTARGKNAGLSYEVLQRVIGHFVQGPRAHKGVRVKIQAAIGGKGCGEFLALVWRQGLR